MIEFLFSFLSAFFESMKDVSSKWNLKTMDEYVVAWVLPLFTLPLPIIFSFFTKAPVFGNMFFVALLICGPLNALAAILFMKALKASDLSLTAPMVAFTPLFLLFTSPLILAEFPSFFGLIGVLLIVCGAYVLNVSKKNKGYLAPLKALLKEKGPRLMLAVAFIWSITSNVEKIGVQNSSPLFWVISFNAFMVIILFPLMLYKSRNCLGKVKKNLKHLAPIGAFNSLTLIFQMTAITMTLVAYVISIKRCSVVFGVLFGNLLFKEKCLRERLIGAIIMVIGVALILLG